ncbi:MAG: choice-of-anchor M domain-containing protein [Cutibacterium granulosum]|uniref:choice-of-anchor M domain-containing protein n=1 Tax=Cutibacterium granulosum TaxID=33011 RepID=UPI002B232390|nr:choice-of-anchor M domain-containing protein [Cutibacterium granulosum]MEA5659766.1 choice-of-anchor M domain-containing protein [Cutibacterium granulosum]MEA5660641.1 choice-of-anchor M domain-containing protein [Cutibacterium granulosum]
MIQMRRMLGSVLAAGMLAAGGVNPTLASAGPDDSKTIATQEHVDSPKVFWDESAGNFVLRTNVGQNPPPIETTALWVGKGYNDAGHQQYIHPITKDNAPELGFAGKPGDLLYRAPAQPGFSRSPIWAGFGADTNVPIERFRDQSFTLDMVGFDGPGRMEMFNNYGTEHKESASRLLSSHDVGLRSAFLTAGSHTHNDTTFTRPGRYEMTYRASARDTNGTLIHSAPQTLVWQVGGTKPSAEGLGDVAKAYQASSTTTSPSFAPKLSLAPHAGRDKDGDEHLSQLEFTTGDSADQGTAIFYIDGYHLAEVPVSSGHATWTEMVGSQSSNFQVVYVPRSGHSPRWVSAPIAYTTGQQRAQTSQPGQFPTKASQDPAPAFDTNEFTDGSDEATVTSSVKDGSATVTVTPADPRMIAHVKGGFSTNPKDDIPDCDVDFVSGPNTRSVRADVRYCGGDATSLKLDITPLPRDHRSAAHMKVSGGLTSTTQVRWGENTGDVNPTSATSAPTNPAQPAPTALDGHTDPARPAPTVPAPTGSQPGAPTEPGQGANPSDTSPVTIDRGHVDVGPVISDGGATMALVDDSRTHATQTVLRDPESVRLSVPDHAKHVRGDVSAAEVRKAGLSGRPVFPDHAYDFLGAKGTPVWVLPQNQTDGLVWPGFSTERMPTEDYPDGVNLTLTPISAPDKGAWWAFTAGLSNDVTMLGSSEKPHEIVNKAPAHIHNNWVFTKPGTYVIGVSASGKNASGQFNVTQKKMTFVVGDEAATALPTPGGDAATPGRPAEPTPPSASGPTASASPSNQSRNPATPDGQSTPATPHGPGTPVPSSSTNTKVILDHGHVDVFHVGFTGGKLDLKLKEDVTGSGVIHEPQDVDLQVKDSAFVDVPRQFPGALRAYVLPMTQNQDLLWPGWDTMSTGKPVDLVVDSVQGPGKVHLFTTDISGTAVSQLTSGGTALPGTISVPSPTHVHANWVFTKPGVYTMTVHAASGVMRSTTKTYTWRVGGDATAAPSSSASAEPSESASPSEEPSAPADDETVTPLPDPSVDPEDTPSADPSDEATPSDEESVDSGSTGDEATIPATSEATQAADNAPAASLGGASAGTIALPRTGN